QHECDYNLSEVESIAEILAYCPALINYQSNGEYIRYQHDVQLFLLTGTFNVQCEYRLVNNGAKKPH
uniref:Uncharacterized protein n=1 Tax=Romanomermis culicivorax TaxID=13658 RepID=A0A915J362_ROMCU